MTPTQIFEAKAYYNKWLNQLTENEKDLILEMLKEAQQEIDKAREEGFQAGCDFTCKQYGEGKTENQIKIEELQEFYNSLPSQYRFDSATLREAFISRIDKLISPNKITSNGCREMTEVRFNEGLKEYKQTIITLVDEMIKEFTETDETVTHLQETVHDAKIRTLIQLKQKIEQP